MGVVGGREWVSENTSLFCTESTLGSVFFIRKKEKIAKNVGVKGENVNIFGEKTFFELTTIIRSSEFLPGKSEIFSAGIENFCDWIHDTPRLQTRLTPLTIGNRGVHPPEAMMHFPPFSDFPSLFSKNLLTLSKIEQI